MSCLIPILLAYTAGALSVMAWGVALSLKAARASANVVLRDIDERSDWRRWQ